jgi:hypothetical protein
LTTTQTSTIIPETQSEIPEATSRALEESASSNHEEVTSRMLNEAASSILVENALTSSSEYYNGCAVTKGCFGSEANCITDGTCKLMFSYQSLSGTKSFQMMLHGKEIGANEYISVGISSDDLMGSDIVFFCYNGATGINVAWNKGKDNIDGVTGITVADAKIRPRDLKVLYPDGDRPYFRRNSKLSLNEDSVIQSDQFEECLVGCWS